MLKKVIALLLAICMLSVPITAMADDAGSSPAQIEGNIFNNGDASVANSFNRGLWLVSGQENQFLSLTVGSAEGSQALNVVKDGYGIAALPLMPDRVYKFQVLTKNSSEGENRVSVLVNGESALDLIVNSAEWFWYEGTFATAGAVAGSEIELSAVACDMQVDRIVVLDISTPAPTPLPEADLVLTLDPSITYQTIEGLGFSHSLVFDYPLDFRGTPDPVWIDYITNDLGLSMWRTSLDAMDEVTTPDGFHNWSNKRQDALALKEAMDAAGTPLKVILSCWSPPGGWKVKTNDQENTIQDPGVRSLAQYNAYRDLRLPHNRLVNAGTLNPDNYADYANWFVEAIDMYKEIGIDVYAISLQNEPGFLEPYDSCIYTWEWYNEMIKACIPIIKAAHPDVLVFGAECMTDRMINEPAYWRNANYWRQIVEDPETNALVDRLAAHGSGSRASWELGRSKFGSTSQYNKGLWMTETEPTRNSFTGVAMQIGRALAYGDVSAFTYWCISGEDLISLDNLATHKIWQTMKQFYRYIRPDAVRIDATLDRTLTGDNLVFSAYTHEELDNTVVVFTNSSSNSYIIDVTGAGIDAWDYYITTADVNVNNQFTADVDARAISVPAGSVVTIIKGAYEHNGPGALTDDQKDSNDIEMSTVIAERGPYSVSAAVAGSEADAKHAANLAVAPKLLKGVAYTVNTVSFTEATPYDDGEYIFNITLSKGNAGTVTRNINMTLRAIPIQGAELIIDTYVKHQTIVGLGLMSTNDAPGWANKVVEDLGVSLWEDFIDPANPFDGKQEAVSELAAAYFEKHGYPLKAALSVLSPPAEMKTATNATPNPDFPDADMRLRTGRLDPAKNADFAEWLINELKKYEEAGMEIYALSLAHEPAWAQPFQSSCAYTAVQYAAYVNAIVPLVKVAYPDVVIYGPSMPMMFNLAPWAQAILQMIEANLTGMNNVRNLIDVYSTTSGGSKEDWAVYYSGNGRFTGVNSSANPSYAGTPAWSVKTNWANDEWASSALNLAYKIQEDLIYGIVTAWTYSGYYIGADDNGLTTGNVYSVLKHFYRFISPGAVRIDAVLDKDDVTVTAFENTDGTYTIVFVNDGDNSYEVNIGGAGLPESFYSFITTVSASDNCRLNGIVNLSDSVLVPAKSVVTLTTNYQVPLVYCEICGELEDECTCVYCEICGELEDECTCVFCEVCGKDPCECIFVVGYSNAKYVSIVETSKNSRVWKLTFTVTKHLSNKLIENKTFSIDLAGNNANLDGKFKFEKGHELFGYTLVYDIKGNGSNIKAFGIVS
ncbi:MAG: hypothetical protein FWE82_08050 [Defluviitaleaceae bacterium]|nr:hypothetical protein [Defluviitaleaceae bacterium]